MSSKDDAALQLETMHALVTGGCIWHGRRFVDCRGCWLAQTGKPERPNRDWARAVLKAALGSLLALLLSVDGFGCSPW